MLFQERQSLAGTSHFAHAIDLRVTVHVAAILNGFLSTCASRSIRKRD